MRDITTDIGIPTILAFLRDETNDMLSFALATSTRLDPERAMVKAIEELALTRLYGKVLRQDAPNFSWNADFRDITDLDDHVLLYTFREMLPATEFLLNPGYEKRLDDEMAMPIFNNLVTEIDYCLEQVKSAGLDVIVIDLTTSEIANVGFRVVRVLIPGMQPLNADHRMKYLGGRRLFEVPCKMGYTSSPTNELQLNPYPHPFP